MFSPFTLAARKLSQNYCYVTRSTLALTLASILFFQCQNFSFTICLFCPQIQSWPSSFLFSTSEGQFLQTTFPMLLCWLPSSLIQPGWRLEGGRREKLGLFLPSLSPCPPLLPLPLPLSSCSFPLPLHIASWQYLHLLPGSNFPCPGPARFQLPLSGPRSEAPVTPPSHFVPQPQCWRQLPSVVKLRDGSLLPQAALSSFATP